LPGGFPAAEAGFPGSLPYPPPVPWRERWGICGIRHRFVIAKLFSAYAMNYLRHENSLRVACGPMPDLWRFSAR
jgi:hypothetical protein